MAKKKSIQITRVGTADLWEQFSRNPIGVYRDVATRMEDAGFKEAPTLSRVLEVASPSENNDPSDAFSRLMREADIRTRSNYEVGYWASTVDEFLDGGPGTRALMMEFYAREWRKVSFAKRRDKRAVLLSGDGIIGSFERPYADATSPREDDRIEPAIPLSELIAITTPITGNAYRTFYFEYDPEKARLYRVGETAEIPMMTVQSHKNSIDIFKYGGGITASYEEMRRMRVDRMAFLIRRMAVQSEIDKVATVVDVLVNGDGNPNTTPDTLNLTDLDSEATVGELSLRAWFKFKMSFKPPYILTTTLQQEDPALQLALLNTGSGNMPLVSENLGNLGINVVPINQLADNVRFGWLDEAPSNKLVAFDRRLAIERVVEVGSSISEMDRFVNNQTQVFTMTETEGYGVIERAAIRLLDLNQ